MFAVESFISRSRFLDEDRAYGPLNLECCACHRTANIFDPELHGYDVEINHFPPHPPYPGDRRRYRCSSCTAESLVLIARFQYSSRAGQLHRSDGSPIPKEDLFTYFTLIGRCKDCGAHATISSAECA